MCHNITFTSRHEKTELINKDNSVTQCETWLLFLWKSIQYYYAIKIKYTLYSTLHQITAFALFTWIWFLQSIHFGILIQLRSGHIVAKYCFHSRTPSFGRTVVHYIRINIRNSTILTWHWHHDNFFTRVNLLNMFWSFTAQTAHFCSEEL